MFGSYHALDDCEANRSQTGVTDLPLTANGERMVTDMGNRIIGPGSEYDNSGQTASVWPTVRPLNADSLHGHR